MNDLSSQVTIGSGTRPHEFSVLELISNSKGLRLPQMSKEDKIKAFGNDDTKLKALTSPEKEAAMGLQIFNLSTQCVETWNGERWIFGICTMMPVKFCSYPLWAGALSPPGQLLTTATESIGVVLVVVVRVLSQRAGWN